MPIYEFYCDDCNVIFNFLSSTINTSSSPDCPQCGKAKLPRQISRFATVRSKGLDENDPYVALDESKMEKAFESIMKEAGSVNEEDPRQLASLMRKFTDTTGLNLGDAMNEAMSRMEAGEDPEVIEQEMGDILEDDDLSLEAVKRKFKTAKAATVQDEKLYKL